MAAERPVPRFGSVRRRYIWSIMRRGPTEIGYAYFRARRRRRNRADDETLLTESDDLALNGGFDATDAILEDNRRLIEGYLARDTFRPRSVVWMLPFFHHVYFGGTYTLLRFAEHFARVHDVSTHFHCYDVGPSQLDGLSGKVRAAFPALAPATFTSAWTPLPELPATDLAIATLWTSAYQVLKLTNTQAKFYFVQDNEPQFYAAGAASGLAEETYRFGFPGIVNTPGLAEVYASYGNAAVSFVPAVDTGRYHPPTEPRDPSAPVRVFFYGRSQSSRNSFGLGLAALKLLKRRYGDRVEIVCAGEDWNPGQFGMNGQITNLGVLGSLEEVAALYRSCDIGLVFMQTKHPSYQPFEFMASGMATVSNINPATSWLLRDGENCLLTPPLPTPTAERLGRLVDDADLRRRIAAAGVQQIAGYRWEEQIEKVWAAICLRDEAGDWRRRPEAPDAPVGSLAPADGSDTER
jgi:glycosyltransferase involved in cell wall biosynthesis